MSLVRMRSDWGLSPLPQTSPVDRLFDDLSRQMFGELGRFGQLGMTRSFPAVDVVTKGDDVVLKVELPGIDPENDVEVFLQEGTLHIRGERRFESEQNGDGFRRIERSYGSFSRSFNLPEGVAESDISAAYNQGVLEIRVQGAAASAPRTKIPIRTGIGTKVAKALGRGDKNSHEDDES